VAILKVLFQPIAKTQTFCKPNVVWTVVAIQNVYPLLIPEVGKTAARKVLAAPTEQTKGASLSWMPINLIGSPEQAEAFDEHGSRAS
jgi:hypothetical protein